jgi:hypothetical protein
MNFIGGPYQQGGGAGSGTGGGNYSHPRGYSADFSDDFGGGDSQPWYAGSPEKPPQTNYSNANYSNTNFSNEETNPRYSGRFDLQEEDYSSEPPLLEEIGIRFDHVWEKTQAVILINRVSSFPLSANPCPYFLFRKLETIF